MTFERSEWIQRLSERPPPKARSKPYDDVRAASEMLRQASIKMESVTGHAGWDTFLSMLQARIEAAERAVEDARLQLTDPERVNPDELARLRNVAIQNQAKIEAWKEVMELPKRVMTSVAVCEALEDE